MTRKELIQEYENLIQLLRDIKSRMGDNIPAVLLARIDEALKTYE